MRTPRRAIEWQNGAWDFTHVGTVVFPLAFKHNLLMYAKVCYFYINHALEIREMKIDLIFIPQIANAL